MYIMITLRTNHVENISYYAETILRTNHVKNISYYAETILLFIPRALLYESTMPLVIAHNL